MLGGVRTSDTLEPGPVVGADLGQKKAELSVDAQDGILASLEFVVKQPLGAHERRGVVSFVSQQPRSLPSNQPSTRDGKGPRGLLLRLDARSIGRPGVEKDSFGHFCFYCAKPRTGKCCQRPSHKRSERLNVCHHDHATQAPTCLVGCYFYCSTPTLFPLVSLCARVTKGGLDDIAPRSIVSRIWAAVLVCGP